MEQLVPIIFGKASEHLMEFAFDMLAPKLTTLLEMERKHFFDRPTDPNFEDMIIGKMESVYNVLESVSGKIPMPVFNPSSPSTTATNPYPPEMYHDQQMEKHQDVFQTLFDAIDVTEALKQLYEAIDTFTIHNILSDTTKYNHEQNRLLSSVLVNYDEPYISNNVPSFDERMLVFQLQERLCNSLQAQNHFEQLRFLLPSTSTLLLPDGKLKTRLPSKIFQEVRSWLKKSRIKIAHKSENACIGNVAVFHKNTENLIACSSTCNIFQAVSKVLMGTPNYADLIQTCTYELFRSCPEVVQKCKEWTNWKSRENIDSVRLNILKKKALPQQLTIAVLSEVIQRDIIIHIGAYSGGHVSVRIGDFPNKIPVNLMELHKRLYPLIPVEGVPIRMDKNAPVLSAHLLRPCYNKWQDQDPTNKDFGEFGIEMECLFEICEFCQDFHNDECGHVTELQWQAYTLLRNIILNPSFGRSDRSQICNDDIDGSAFNWLSESLHRNFDVINTPMDGNCLFSSCAYYLTKSFDMSFPLRKCTLVEFRRNRNLYYKYYKESNIHKDEIFKNNLILSSLKKWGNSFTLALMSRITNRKIVVFEPENIHVTYDVAITSTKDFQPIFLYLRNNHFQPMIPKVYTPALIPQGKKNQYSLIRNLELEYVLNVEHNYTRPEVGRLLYGRRRKNEMGSPRGQNSSASFSPNCSSHINQVLGGKSVTTFPDFSGNSIEEYDYVGNQNRTQESEILPTQVTCMSTDILKDDIIITSKIIGPFNLTSGQCENPDAQLTEKEETSCNQIESLEASLSFANTILLHEPSNVDIADCLSEISQTNTGESLNNDISTPFTMNEIGQVISVEKENQVKGIMNINAKSTQKNTTKGIENITVNNMRTLILSQPKDSSNESSTSHTVCKSPQPNEVQDRSLELQGSFEKENKLIRFKFPWNRAITDTEKLQLESVFASCSYSNEMHLLDIIVNERNVSVSTSEYLPNIFDTLNITTRSEIPRDKVDDYILFAHCILPDIALMGNNRGQENFVHVFVQRCTFDSFWNSNVVRVKQYMHKRKNPNLTEAKKKAKKIMSFQSSDIARKLTMELMMRANFSKESITTYSNLMKNSMDQFSKAKSRTGGLKVELDALFQKTRVKSTNRTLPTFTYEGLLATHKLELEMYRKMDASEVSKLKLQIEKKVLPDDIGQSLIENLNTLEIKSKNEIAITCQQLTPTKAMEFIIPWNETTGNITIDVTQDDQHSTVSSVTDNTLTEITKVRNPFLTVKPMEFNTSVTGCGDIEHSTQNIIQPDHDLPQKKEVESSLREFSQNKDLEQANILFEFPGNSPGNSGDELEKDTGLESQKNPSPVKFGDVTTNQKCSIISSKLINKEDEEIHEKEALAKEIFPEHILNFVPPENFQMIISADEMKKCYNFATNKFIPCRWTQVISENITKTQGVCAFKTRHVPDYYSKKSSGFCVMTGSCGCSLNFKVKVPLMPQPDKPVVFEVNAQGEFKLIQIRSCGRFLRGEDRRIMGERLAHNMPTKVLLENLSSASPLELLHNTTKQYSLESLQQLRHQVFKAGTTCLDPMSDLMAFARETEKLEVESTIVKGFIHMVKESQSNVQIHMYTEMGLRLLSSQKSGSILYVDATGGLTFPVNNKQMLFYLAFLETKEGHIAPIASSLAHKGRAIDIADLFVKIRGDMSLIKRDTQRPLASIIVTDFSFAMISGVLQGCNIMDLKDYIIHASNAILDKEDFDESRSVIFVCTSHIMHSFSRLLRKHLPSTQQYKHIRQLSLHSMARLQACTDLASFQTTVSCIIECFGLQYCSEEKLELNIKFLKGEVEIEDNFADICTDDVEDYNAHKLLREKSPFYKEFMTIKHSILGKLNPLNYENQFYSPVVVDLFEKFYCPYFQLFGSAILAKTGRHHKGSITNGMAESEFNTLKTYVHQKRKLPFNLFIRQHYTYHTGRIREIFLPVSQKNRRIKKRIVRAEQRYRPENKEEKWSKNKKRSRTNAYVRRNVFKIKQANKSTTHKDQAISFAKNLVKENISQQNLCYYSTATGIDLTENQALCSKVDLEDNTIPKDALQQDATKVKMPIDVLADIAYDTIDEDGQPDVQFFSLNSNQLADICDPNYLLDLDEMNALMRYASNAVIRSEYSVSNTHFVWKGEKYHTNMDVSNLDPRILPKILHPMLVKDHWILLQISRHDAHCRVYDPKDKTLALLEELISEVLPFFSLPGQDIKWKVEFANDFPTHKDSSSAILIFETSRLIHQRRPISSAALKHVDSECQTRTTIVRDLLRTTSEGKILLAKKLSDINLRRTLKVIHSMCHKNNNSQPIPRRISETRKETTNSDTKKNSGESSVRSNLNLESTKSVDTVIDHLARVPYSTIDKDGQPSNHFLSLKGKQLAAMLDPELWIADDEMDVMMKLAVMECSSSEYMISDVHFAWKQIVDHPNVRSHWQSLYKFDDCNIDTMDPRKSLKILHPLIIRNHWILLQISKSDGKCIVYDSLLGSRSQEMLQEIQAEVLPLFTLPHEQVNWKAEYARNFPEQKDSSSCGIFVYETTRLILNGERPCRENLMHVQNQRQLRSLIVRKLLNTTTEGKQVLREVNSDDAILKRSLTLISSLCDDLAERKLKKKSTAKLEGKDKAAEQTVSEQISIQSKPFEEIYHDKRNNTAAMQMLTSKLVGNSGEMKDEAIDGSENIKELFRRLGWCQKSPSKDSDCSDFDIEKELEEWDTLHEKLEVDIKRKLVPFYEEKEKMYNEHCIQIKQMKEEELRNLLNQLLPDIKGVCTEKISSIRHQSFVNSYSCSSKFDPFFHNVTAPFTESQDYFVGMKLARIFDENTMPNLRPDQVDRYVQYVLKPEALARIFALKNRISICIAEKELKYCGAYDGELPQ